jgi:penicillin amidase
MKALWTALMASPSCLRALLSLPRAPTALDDRVAALPTSGLPLRAPATIYFDRHQIPFIVAENDGDAAFTLGLVHAHLRLAQMEVLRRIAHGRVAEMLGPLAIPLDETLRTLNLARAAARIEAALPPQTRDWMQAVVDGVNLYVRRAESLPIEFKALGLHVEAWTIRDLVAMGRLISSDINWLIGAELLRYRRRGDWSQIWARLTTAANDDAERARHLATSVLQQCGRSGSNCLAVSAQKTKRKAAILAGDPHVSLLLPNTWLIAGVQSPSFHAVGLMVPGLPVFMMGRNERIAWGGTYLRAASSDFVDVSGISRSSIRLRHERLKVRWWCSVNMKIRESDWGPVVSECPLFRDVSNERIALRWMGHEESDEFSAFLEVARARDFDGFRAAFRSYAVSGQTFLYADVDGNIGRVTAARLPARDAGAPADLLRSPGEITQAWSCPVNADTLPTDFNVGAGHIVSANEQPQCRTAIGYFFSPRDRAERMSELLDSETEIGLEQIFSLQSDVHVHSSAALRDLVLAKLQETNIAALDSAARSALEAISGWDGNYSENSKGALAFEACRAALVARLCKTPLIGSDWAAFASIAALEDWVRVTIAHASTPQLREALAVGIEAAGTALRSFGDWGGMHRLSLMHPFGLFPVVGRAFCYADVPVGGSSESLFKTAHGPVRGRHNVLFGSNARHVFDLCEPDENFFVLLGGQDGWLGSTTFLDQLALWRSGRYIKVPMTLDAVRRNAAARVELTP